MLYENNPFNLRYDGHSHWLGFRGHKNGFCEFKSLFYGVRACVYLLERTYKKRGILSVYDIIHTFAPLSDGNNTDAYVNFVCKYACISSSDIFVNLNYDVKVKVLQAMCKMETGFFLDSEIIKRVYYWF